jgi:single stranded DNA-binding protein
MNMLNINEARLMGRLADDPTFGSTPKGGEYMRCRVITSRSWRDADGNWQEAATGHNVVTFDKYRIAHGRKSLRKGVAVYVEGENSESRREVNGEVFYNRGILVPMGGKLHSIEPNRSGENERNDDAPPPAQSAAGRGKGKGKVPDGPPINGQNPLDDHGDYDDEIPF